MARAEPGWELYRSLLAVVREGSLSAAARSLALAQPTIGRHIDALEEQLGVALFVRSQAGLVPTDAALTLMPHAEAMATSAEALLRAASGRAEDEQGSVRLTASELVGAEIVAPLLAPFREQHPRIAIELMLSSRTEDLLRREADIAVRLFRPTQSALIARRLGELWMGLHAHPSYVAARGAPRTVKQLRDHALIGFDSEVLVRRTEKLGLGSRDALSFRCDSYLGQYAALKAGLGIGSCPVVLGRRDGLTRVLPKEPGASAEVWLAMHEDLRTSRRVRLFYDFLADALGAYLSGEPS
ncbi:LysR family transcriptional regulator [Sorangium sp. So ce1128]